MENKPVQKGNGPSKSFLTVGPTLHYSHTNVRLCWALALLVYAVACLIWTRIHTGFWTPGIENLADRSLWGLGPYVNGPVSIFEYPWQILVLAILMGIMAASPVLVSQLLSFRFALPLVLCVAVLARLPLFGVFVLVSSFAAACRPLRFRSRFIAVALCMAPQMAYWAIFGGGQSEPISWGFAYAPWVGAWLVGLSLAGVIIGIGHFTRYRPGILWTVTAFALGLAVAVFTSRISFAELDYQLYVAGNNPEELPEFHDHDLKGVLDKAVEDPGTRSFLQGLGYPAEASLVREELKREIQVQLGYDRWPHWFEAPEELRYQEKRQRLLRQYDLFLQRWPLSRRMPIALYYRALLNEYSPDVRWFAQKEVLRFYSDYPHHENLPIWHRIYEGFGRSPESVEGRYRFATHQAGRGQFEKALELCAEAIALGEEHLKRIQEQPKPAETFWTAFAAPPDTAITPLKLRRVLQRLRQLQSLLGEHNRDATEESRRRLAQFVILNPYRRDYPERIDELLVSSGPNDPLRDNLLLAQTLLLTDVVQQKARLREIYETYRTSDAGMQALYELGLLEVNLWKDAQASAEAKKVHLSEAKAVLGRFVETCPQSVFCDAAREILLGLPGQ